MEMFFRNSSILSGRDYYTKERNYILFDNLYLTGRQLVPIVHPEIMYEMEKKEIQKSKNKTHKLNKKYKSLTVLYKQHG